MTYEDELLEEYYKGQTNGFNAGYANAVDKAVEWLRKSTILADTTIERFKKAMEL